MEIVTLIAGKIWDSLFDALGRQLGYLVHYNDNLKNFQKQTKRLEDMKERVQGQIEAAKRNGELIETDVQTWLADVDNAIDAKNLVTEAEANKRCLNGWCINLRSRYKFSKRAKKETNAITELQEHGKFEKVSHPAPPPGISSSTEFSGAFESRRSIMKQVVETLIDENIHMIGICGMGGIGKTTMVKEIGNQAKEDKLFNEVVMATVSQHPSLTNIQEDIANMLGLKLDSPREPHRAGLLRQRIKQNRILIILDDVWERLDLEKVGIPYGNDHKGCKIILTSRSEIVCNRMDAQKIFSVGGLSYQESWSLFRNTAGEVVDSAGINPIARKIVAECGGLPIAILTIARALKDKKDTYVWTDADRQLQKSVPTNIPGIRADVFSLLKLSYDYLESKEAKSLFLLCCLYPEDFNIPVEELVRYGMGLQLFQNVDTVEDARGRARYLVSILISSFLLLEGTSTYGRRCVKMHDVVRDVAIDIVKDDFLVKAGIGLREWPNMNTFDRFTAISLMYNDIHELPNGLECSRLQTLLLQCNSNLENIPVNFFQEMKDLKVLDMTENPLIPLPPSIQFLSELRTLCLRSRGKAKIDISVIGKLNKLEILRLSGDGITAIPEHFSLLTQLRLFDLNDCDALTHISPGVISSLHKLEELHMSKHFRGWDEEQSRSNASLFELKSLTRLTVLNNIRISDVRFLPNEFEFQKLTGYDISIGTAFLSRYHISIGTEDLSSSRNLELTHDMSIPLLDCVKKLLERVEGLRLEKCTGLRNMFRDLDNNKFIELKSLRLHDCNEMVYFSELPAESSFSNLRKITVMHCPKMLIIVPLQLLLRLQSLEEVSVEHCDSLVCVFEVERGVTAKEETKFLSMLKRLSLWNLPEMTHIWRGFTQFVSLCNLVRVSLFNCKKLRVLFPPALVQDLRRCLEYLDISSCDSLEEIFGKQEGKEGKEIVVWKNDPNVLPCFNNLTFIRINECGELRIVFTHSIAKGLVQLQRLFVYNCEKLEEIVGNEEQGEASSTEKIMFPHLQSVTLTGLPNLTSFCSKHYTIEWPALDDLEIKKCPKMKPFGSGLEVTPKLKTVKYAENDEVSWMGDRNSIFIKGELLLSLQSLEEVSVHYCDSLVCVFEVERGVTAKEETKFLSMLKRLSLMNLPEMTHIWRGSTQFVSLCNLVRVSLIECNKLRILFTHSIAKGLVQLQKLFVEDCEKLQEIVGNEEEGEASSTEKIMFPHLQSVTLQGLSSLTSFCTERYTIELPALDDLEIEKCPKMKPFGSGLEVTPKLKTISWTGDRNSTVHHIHIFIKGEIIVPLQLLQRLQSLENVSVEHCDSLVCVFEVERGVIAKEETKFLSMLKSINLKKLPEMTHIWRGSTQFVSLCNLVRVSLDNCKKLRVLFPAALVQDLKCLEDLDIRRCDSLEEIFGKQEGKEGKEIVVWKNDPNVLPCFNNLTSIRIKGCGELRILFTHSIAKGLVQLQRLFVEDCEKLEEIVGNEEEGEASSTEKIMFPHLQSVRLVGLPSLTSFCSKHYTIEWPALDDLHIIECPKMEILGSGLQVTPKLKKIWIVENYEVSWMGAENYEVSWMGDRNSTVHDIIIKGEIIVPLQLLLSLQSLEEVSVDYCHSLVCVFEVERGVTAKEETKFLSMLKWLSLTNLPEMTHIWRGSTQFVSLCNLVCVSLFNCKKLRVLFPRALVQDLICLEYLDIIRCDSLEEIFGKQEGKEGKEIVVWKNDPNVLPCFNNLTFIRINECGELRIVFTHSIAKGLVQLQRLFVEDCEKLEEIVGNEEEGEASSTEKIMFPHLQHVRLRGLPSLTSFCAERYTIEWPALNDLAIIKCPKMEIFGSGLQVTPKLKNVWYGYGNEEYCWMGDLNTTVLHIFKEEELARQQS